MLFTRVLTTIAVLGALLAAGSAQASDDPVRLWATKLGAPATASAVDTALDDTAAGEGDAVALARALAASRGVEAARGLGTLLKRRDAKVRIEAMLGLARVGLRSSGLAERLHKRLADAHISKRERWAAVVALGAVGDGRDMEVLLGFASRDTEDRELRAGAFRALAAITKVRIPFVHARWTYWWRKYETRGADRVKKAIEALEAAPGAPDAIAHEAALAAYGWADLATLSEALARWLGGSAKGLEAVACRLASYHRLADLAPAIVALGNGRGVKTALRDASAKAAKRLGVAAVEPAR